MSDPSTRARDSDRDRVVAALDEAYVDGQLSDADRSLRVDKALGARTLGELDALVSDLQGLRPPSARVSKRAVALVGVAGATALLMIAGMISLFADGDPSESAAVAERAVEVQTSSPPKVDTPTETPDEKPETTAKPLTKRYFEDFLDAYRERFGTTKVYDAGFYEAGYVSFKRPHSRERKDLLQDWTWYADRGFEKSSIDASANVFEYVPFNLEPVDFKALARHVVHGRKYLGVRNPTMYVWMRPRASERRNLIVVDASNDHGDSGRRYVLPDGTLVESDPFVIPDQR